MEPNLHYWKTHGESFFSRLRLWFKILDQPLTIPTKEEIERVRLLTQHGTEITENVWIQSLSTIHNGSGGVLPIIHRAQVFPFISGPLVAGILLPNKGVLPAIVWQFCLHSYLAEFNRANGNGSKKNVTTSLLTVGAISYGTVAGALPEMILSRYGHVQAAKTFSRFLAIPLTAGLAAFNLVMVRYEEGTNGIPVYDSKGDAVGVSKAAGYKAIIETAISRAVLFGSSATLPFILVSLFKKKDSFIHNQKYLRPLTGVSAAFMFCLMAPLCYSLFPQLGKIKKEKLEKEFQSLEGSGELFYHRGL